MDKAGFALLLLNDARALGLEMSAAQAGTLIDYLVLLDKWNSVYNLTAIRDPEQMRLQHLTDSLALLPALDARGVSSVLDVGTGGGLPGMVLAIMRPSWRVVLNDIVQKKTAFLIQAKATLKLGNVDVHTGRVEAFDDPQRFDAVVSRAFADLGDFVALSKHLVVAGGALFAMKGQRPDEEVERLPDGAAVERMFSLDVPGLQAARHVVVVRLD
jgi:16S rRNA (guanine527-N7)-methyltransferase